MTFIVPLLPFHSYMRAPATGSYQIHGGISSLATGQPLDSVPTDLPVTAGLGKLLVIINAGSDVSGSITVTGTSVNRETGAETGSDTDTLTVDTLSTDTTATDAGGNTVYGFSDAYITSKWFTGATTLSTADLTLTDVDVYQVAFEQGNDTPGLVLDTFDISYFAGNAAAEMFAYLYSLIVTGDKCVIASAASLVANGAPAANVPMRKRKGQLGVVLDGTKDGFWIDVHLSNSPVYVTQLDVLVWLLRRISH